MTHPPNLHAITPAPHLGRPWVLARITCQRCNAPVQDGNRTDGNAACYGEAQAISQAEMRRTCAKCRTQAEWEAIVVERERMFPRGRF